MLGQSELLGLLMWLHNSFRGNNTDVLSQVVPPNGTGPQRLTTRKAYNHI